METVKEVLDKISPKIDCTKQLDYSNAGYKQRILHSILKVYQRRKENEAQEEKVD